MSTRALRNGFVACGLVCALGAAAGPVGAQLQGQQELARRLYWQISVGGGSLRLSCEECSDWQRGGGPFLEGEGGLDISPSVRITADLGGGGAASHPLAAFVGWALVGARVRPPAWHGLYLQGSLGGARASLERATRERCDFAPCLITFGLVGVGFHNVTNTNAPVGQLAAGYELRTMSRTWLTAEAGLMVGRVAMTGLSLGVSHVLASW